MRAREPDTEGVVERRGVGIGYEVFGGGEQTILLLPTWTIVHSRFWKLQIPHLARHFRVVTYDGPGNGRSDRPLDTAAYEQPAQVDYALGVLDATGTDRAVVVGLSQAANWALDLGANHPDRVEGMVFIAPSLALATHDEQRLANAGQAHSSADVAPSAVPRLGTDPAQHWAKYSPDYWLAEHEDFLWFFFGQCFPEPYSTKMIDDAVGWGLDTAPEALVAERAAPRPDEATLRRWCEQVSAPVLVIHGTDDRVSPRKRGEILANLTGGELLVLDGAGHIPLARDPVQINLAIERFANTVRRSRLADRSWVRGRNRRKRVLYLSSPIGLGHAQRDVAVARELRALHPDVEIDWLAQHPVTKVLESAGERIHPASSWLVNESAHIESESGEHDLHCFEALRRMDEILCSNFMLFHDVVSDEPYDLVISDEAWEVDHFLHENPELKRFAYAWFTDFVGYLPMPDAEKRETLVTADYNAEMIEHIERFPRIRDRAIFVGDPDDIVPHRFGEGLPVIRDWTQAHYAFAGYVTGFDPAEFADRETLRAALGYAPDEQVCVVTVGGSGVGGDLLRRVIAAFPATQDKVPGLRMVVVSGPRIDPASLPSHDGLEVRAYVPELYRHLAACDLAVVQGGLTTCMELTATRRPFIYVPLRHHFEQHFHVDHRLRRYGAGRRLDFADADPDHLADLIAAEIGRPVDYRPVAADGARRAATLLADLL
jgi:pimeloyl-ACP methyl ester carboxylesterase/predicted glycosyltransferase